MKKVMQIANIDALKKPESHNGQIIFGRAGDKVWMQNLELLPSNRVNMDLKDDVFTIKIILKDGEYVALKDVKGVANKEWVCGED